MWCQERCHSAKFTASHYCVLCCIFILIIRLFPLLDFFSSILNKTVWLRKKKNPMFFTRQLVSNDIDMKLEIKIRCHWLSWRCCCTLIEVQLLLIHLIWTGLVKVHTQFKQRQAQSHQHSKDLKLYVPKKNCNTQVLNEGREYLCSCEFRSSFIFNINANHTLCCCYGVFVRGGGRGGALATTNPGESEALYVCALYFYW